MDLKEYEALGYNPQQLRQIEDALNNGLEIKKYIDPRMDWMQIEQVKLGLMEGLDVSIYADASIPASRMEHIRQKREIESGRTEVQEHVVKQHRLKSLLWRLAVLAGLLIVGVIGYYGKQYYDLVNQDLFIKFTGDEVVIEYGQTFVPANYISEYTQAEGIELVLPESIKTDSIGNQTVIYQIKNAYKAETYELTVKTVDSLPPVITLNSHDVTLTKGEDKFTAEAYIVSASDNVDGNITSKIAVELKDEEIDQTVKYSVSDSSGNETTEELSLHWKNPPEPEVVYVETPVYINSGSNGGGNTYSSNSESDGGESAAEGGHGTQSFMFSDGYDLDSGFAACSAALSQIGYGSCMPMTGSDGLYIGYQLNY